MTTAGTQQRWRPRPLGRRRQRRGSDRSRTRALRAVNGRLAGIPGIEIGRRLHVIPLLAGEGIRAAAPNTQGQRSRATILPSNLRCAQAARRHERPARCDKPYVFFLPPFLRSCFFCLPTTIAPAGGQRGWQHSGWRHHTTSSAGMRPSSPVPGRPDMAIQHRCAAPSRHAGYKGRGNAGRAVQLWGDRPQRHPTAASQTHNSGSPPVLARLPPGHTLLAGQHTGGSDRSLFFMPRRTKEGSAAADAEAPALVPSGTCRLCSFILAVTVRTRVLWAPSCPYHGPLPDVCGVPPSP